MSNRYINVDDTSPLISYQGEWTALSNDTIPDLFYPSDNFNNTLHALLLGSGSFTLNFIGTNVEVVAAFRSFNSTQPSWTCFLDGIVLQSFIPSSSNSTSNFAICSSNTTTSKTTPSNLTVVASGTTVDPFLFDFIDYRPDASTILDNATVVVEMSDSQVQYGSGWDTTTSTYEAVTSVQGASMTFDFVGIRIAWLGFPNATNASTVNSTALYSIDSGTLTEFEVIVFNGSNTWTYTFQTPMLSPGPHRLFVEYNGINDSSNSPVPLVLEALVVENRTITTPNPPSSPNSAGLSGRTIAGVVIGSVVGLALIIFILIRLNKGPKKAAEPESVPLNVYEDGSDSRLQESRLPGADPGNGPGSLLNSSPI